MSQRFSQGVASVLLVAGAVHGVAMGGTTIRVAVAASLHTAVTRAAETYSAGHPVDVRLTTGASGVLLQQIRHGAPVDLFLSASPREIDRLENESRVLPGSRTDVVSNSLVVVVPAAAEPPRTVGELRRLASRRIAIANPRTAPLGRYSRESLESLKLWRDLESAMVMGESSRQVLDYVARDEVDAAIVYRTDAAQLSGRVTAGYELPASSHTPIVYQGAVIADAREPASAEAFLGWLASAEGRRVLGAQGFAPPPEP